MNKTATKLPGCPIVMAMKGAGASLGLQSMAEIGDITRFTYKGALTAFAGVTPGVSESSSYKKVFPSQKLVLRNLEKYFFKSWTILSKQCLKMTLCICL